MHFYFKNKNKQSQQHFGVSCSGFICLFLGTAGCDQSVWSLHGPDWCQGGRRLHPVIMFPQSVGDLSKAQSSVHLICANICPFRGQAAAGNQLSEGLKKRREERLRWTCNNTHWRLFCSVVSPDRRAPPGGSPRRRCESALCWTS